MIRQFFVNILFGKFEILIFFIFEKERKTTVVFPKEKGEREAHTHSVSPQFVDHEPESTKKILSGRHAYAPRARSRLPIPSFRKRQDFSRPAAVLKQVTAVCLQ